MKKYQYQEQVTENGNIAMSGKGNSIAESRHKTAKQCKLQEQIDKTCASPEAQAYLDAVKRRDSARKLWIKNCYTELRAMGLSSNKARDRAQYLYDYCAKHTMPQYDIDANGVKHCPDHASKHESRQLVRCKVPACVSGGYIDLALTAPDKADIVARKRNTGKSLAETRVLSARYDSNGLLIQSERNRRIADMQQAASNAAKKSRIVKRTTIRIAARDQYGYIAPDRNLQSVAGIDAGAMLRDDVRDSQERALLISVAIDRAWERAQAPYKLALRDHIDAALRIAERDRQAMLRHTLQADADRQAIARVFDPTPADQD